MTTGWSGRVLLSLGLCWIAISPGFSQTATSISAAPQGSNLAPLEVVASFNEQPTGVAVSKGGRIFVNFPYWSDKHTNSVVEVKPDKSTEAYPDGTWNDVSAVQSDPLHRFVCVQSVYVDASDKLWVLDPGAPRMGVVVPGAAKLVEINLTSNTVERVYSFDSKAAPPQSYLNDVRVDPARHMAYISDSGLGAILVLDLATGKSRRVLNQVPMTMGTPGVLLKVDDRELRLSSGYAFTINCDGIALDSKGNTLYFQAPTSGALYSIATADLRNEKLSDQALSDKAKLEANIGPADGLTIDADNVLYATSVVDHSIKRVDARETPAFTIVANDPRLDWPDSMAISDGWLYVTASQIPRMPRFNGGQDLAQLPYQVFRFQPLAVDRPLPLPPGGTP